MLKAMATPAGGPERSVIPTSQNPNKELEAYSMNILREVVLVKNPRTQAPDYKNPNTRIISPSANYYLTMRSG